MQQDEPFEQELVNADMEDDGSGNAAVAHSEPQNGELTVSLSRALLRKIGEQAREESISVEDLVRELLSESVVLRAWEIMERKIQMRGGNAQGSHQGGNQRGGNQGGNQGGNRGGHRKGHRGMSHGRYQSIMDDKATFLEYVRNQERNRR